MIFSNITTFKISFSSNLWIFFCPNADGWVFAYLIVNMSSLSNIILTYFIYISSCSWSSSAGSEGVKNSDRGTYTITTSIGNTYANNISIGSISEHRGYLYQIYICQNCFCTRYWAKTISGMRDNSSRSRDKWQLSFIVYGVDFCSNKRGELLKLIMVPEFKKYLWFCHWIYCFLLLEIVFIQSRK